MTKEVDVDFIWITGVNKDKTKIIDYNEGVHSIYFKLSTNPASQWKNLYNQNSTLFGPSTLRESRIENNYVIVDCKLHEIKEFIFDELKKKVSDTNSKFHERIQAQMKSIMENQQEKKEEDFMHIDDAVDGLEF